ncbi:hypothetical protein WD019_18460 [Fictibacillus sp. Mic-4]|uniref:hypothetical protein n=1 Tax=Fictibacillus sp. Mic-4 TaxID=3132826 RepID=UPI003CE67673
MFRAIPAIKDISSFENLLKENHNPNLKGCIITGDKDPYYLKVLELMPVFEANHIPCKLVVEPGLGHFFPELFPALLQTAISYLEKTPE